MHNFFINLIIFIIYVYNDFYNKIILLDLKIKIIMRIQFKKKNL